MPTPAHVSTASGHRAAQQPLTSSCAASALALDGGVDWVQLRDKSASAAAMFGQARQLLTVARQHGAHLADQRPSRRGTGRRRRRRAPGGAEPARRRGRQRSQRAHAGRSLGPQPGRGDSASPAQAPTTSRSATSSRPRRTPACRRAAWPSCAPSSRRSTFRCWPSAASPSTTWTTCSPRVARASP